MKNLLENLEAKLQAELTRRKNAIVKVQNKIKTLNESYEADLHKLEGELKELAIGTSMGTRAPRKFPRGVLTLAVFETLHAAGKAGLKVPEIIEKVQSRAEFKNLDVAPNIRALLVTSDRFESVDRGVYRASQKALKSALFSRLTAQETAGAN